ncbi:MAG TPA: hypothetical protein VN368_02780, partial [Candidatus Methylomirabilis sp.]|nr:hypothetical protein [Candidatus Methylomirabilis sp.]
GDKAVIERYIEKTRQKRRGKPTQAVRILTKTTFTKTPCALWRRAIHFIHHFIVGVKLYTYLCV